MNWYRFTVSERRTAVYLVEAESESAARQAFIDGDELEVDSALRDSHVDSIEVIPEREAEEAMAEEAEEDM